MWEVVFKNGEVLQQFDENGEDRTFAPVSKRSNEVKILTLILKTEDGVEKRFFVNVVTGMFFLDGFTLFSYTDISSAERTAPIFWKRKQVHMFGDSEVVETVGFILGWQATVNGKNFQQRIMVSPSGAIALMSEKE